MTSPLVETGYTTEEVIDHLFGWDEQVGADDSTDDGDTDEPPAA